MIKHALNWKKTTSLHRTHRRARGTQASLPFQGRINLGPHSSLRKLMRAARRGHANGDDFTPLQPSLTALRRHPWYRRKEAWDKLRKLMGQA